MIVNGQRARLKRKKRCFNEQFVNIAEGEERKELERSLKICHRIEANVFVKIKRRWKKKVCPAKRKASVKSHVEMQGKCFLISNFGRQISVNKKIPERFAERTNEQK